MVTSSQPTSLAFGPDGQPGRHSHLFRPPKSPYTTATSPSHATATDYFGPSARKRTRNDVGHARRLPSSTRTPRPLGTSTNNGTTWPPYPTPEDNAHGGRMSQGAAIVNEKYTLAGGFDTPSLLASAELNESNGDYLDRGQRRTREATWDPQVHDVSVPIFGPLARERNGVARTVALEGTASPTSWTGLAFGFVGKVFSFGSSMIRGFYAGPGQGYDLKGNPSDVGQPVPFQEPCSTPVPGAWTHHDFVGDFEQDNFSSPPSSLRPPNKRRQTDKDSWVMVGDVDSNLYPQSPKRKTSDHSVPRLSSALPRPSASRASSRRTLAPTTRRTTSYNAYSTGSPAANPSADPIRASFASPRSPQSRLNNVSTSGFLSPEAERYVKRQARQGKAADRAMSNMSRQLEDLIRQGQEALGTKVSIEGLDHDFDADEGFVDDE